MNYQTPLARARGLGAAREGTVHWWRQRLSSIALIPLTVWLVFSVSRWPHADHGQFVAWISAPWNTVLLLACILLGFFHAALGMQVILEDYVHVDWVKILAIVLVKLTLGFVALAAIFATLRIVFLG